MPRAQCFGGDASQHDEDKHGGLLLSEEDDAHFSFILLI